MQASTAIMRINIQVIICFPCTFLFRHVKCFDFFRTNLDISRVWFIQMQGIRGAAVVLYRKRLITQQMNKAGSPEGCG